MKSYIINAGTLAVTVASLWLPGSAHGQMDMQPTYREMEHIVASQ